MKRKIISMCLGLVIPLSLNAATLFEHLELAKKCYQLSMQIQELSRIQDISFCREKLSSASYYSEIAGEEFIADDISMAKLSLELGITSLGYTAVENCKKADEILSAKNAMKEIYNAAG